MRDHFNEDHSHRRGHHHGHGGRGGEHGGRAKRGEARYILLDALRDGAKHGYEIIKTLEERSAGRYAPSPGTVYPTLQFLEGAGLVRAEEIGERRVYSLTDTGRTELETRSEDIAAFWTRFAQPEASAAAQTEWNFLREELDLLSRTAGGAIDRDDPEILRRVRQAVEGCRSEVRHILSNSTPENTKT